MHFTGNDSYQDFLVFAPMLNSLMLDRNRNVTDSISTGISSEKIKAFDTGLELTMSNLAYGKVKLKVGKLYIGKLETTPVYLSKLSNAVKNDVVKKTEYDELVKNIKAIQTTDTSNLVKKTDYNTKINETEKKNTDHDHGNKYITKQKFNRKFCCKISTSKFSKQKGYCCFCKKDRF